METQHMLKLAERFREHNDHSAFETLFAEIGKPIWSMICRKVPREDAEDVFQDVSLAVAKALARDVVTHVPALTHTIAARAIADFFRKRRLTQSLPGYDDDMDLTDPGPPTFAAARVDSDRLLARCECHERQALILHYCSGCTVPEVAAFMDISTGRAKKIIYLAVKKIRDHLARRGVV
ncbi:MAG: sigma-70 family RNA polymerase sigma factor [Acidobacteriota bacterium]|nr:sigma-70 family RNA polymerase sigma factor [Acidobacteriota bacterium]